MIADWQSVWVAASSEAWGWYSLAIHPADPSRLYGQLSCPYARSRPLKDMAKPVARPMQLEGPAGTERSRPTVNHVGVGAT